MTGSADSGLAAAIVVSALTGVVLGLALYIWYALALSRLFPRIGGEGWKGWVPVLNEAEILARGGVSAWKVVFYFIPIVQLYGLYLKVVATHRINARFGRGAGSTVLAILLPPVWATLLAWGVPPYPEGDRLAALHDGVRRAAAPPLPAADQGGTARTVTSFAPPAAPAGAAPSFGMPPAPVVPQQGPPPVAPPPVWGAPPPVPTSGVQGAPDQAAPAQPAAPAPPPVVSAIPQNLMAAPSTSAPAPQPAPPAPSSPAPSMPAPSTPQPGPSAEVMTPPIVISPPPMVRPAAPAPAQPGAHSRESAAHDESAVEPEKTVTVSRGVDEALEATVVVAKRRGIRRSLVLDDGRSFALSGASVVIGRNPIGAPGEQRLAISDSTQTLSKTHARLVVQGDEWRLTDLDSTNGVVIVADDGAETLLDRGRA